MAAPGEAVPEPRALKMLVVPALFADSPSPSVSAEEVEQVLFGDAQGPTTLARYYETYSSGRVTIDGSVAPWVRTRVPLAQAVGSSWGLGGDAQLGDYLESALSLADASIDFGDLDDDGPGWHPQQR